jgi:hypothetical protein
MALQLGALMEALLEAGATRDTARKAAEEVANYEVANYEGRLATLESRLSTLTWMAGTNVALTIAVLFKLVVRP